MTVDKISRDAIQQLKVMGQHTAEDSKLGASSASNVHSMAIFHSLFSQTVHRETVVSNVESQQKSQHLAKVIESLRRNQASSEAVASSIQSEIKSMENAAAANNNEVASLLFAQLFDFAQSMMDYSISLANQRAIAARPDLQVQNSVTVNPRSSMNLAHESEQQTKSAAKSAATTAQPTIRIMPDPHQVANLRPAASVEHPQTATVSRINQINTNHTVKRTLIFNLPDGQKKRVEQTHTFVRHGRKDYSTGAVTWLGWDSEEAILPAYAVPKVMGYMSEPSQINALKVRPESDNITVQIVYRLQPVQRSQQQSLAATDAHQPALNNEHLQAAVNGSAQLAGDSRYVTRRRPQKVSIIKAFGLAFTTLLGFHRQVVEP